MPQYIYQTLMFFRKEKVEEIMHIQTGRIIAILFIGIILTIQTSFPAMAQPTVDHAIFGALLKSYVKNGQVDYTGLKIKEKQLDQYLKYLENIPPENLERADGMAFYINLYNAWTIKLILTAYPGVKSIKDLGTLFRSPWKKEYVKIHGKTTTLDHIEHDILRPMFKDPRVHFAVNCASKSCPPLLNEPYTGANLNKQLERVARDFINDPLNNFMADGILHVSRIFKWFGNDFGNDIPGYVASYAQGDLAKKMAATGKNIKIKYLDYDWSLNNM
jgi:hypothetical protein